MKTLSLLVLLSLLSLNVFAQDSAFTSINTTPLNTMQLFWDSNTNEYYEIDYANALATNSDGSTAWFPLYTDYPSQGTNTFWQDAGNFNTAPEIPSPQYAPIRFYRILVAGTNDGDDNLSVVITSVTNGESLSGVVDIQVQTTTSQIISKLLLYLDGQELPASPDGTNFYVNTCLSWNGSHTIFATAKSQSGLEGFNTDFSITYNRAVSPMVNVTFNNLITDYQFSQDFFEPTNGETQTVSAVFAEDSDWTLQLFGSSGNLVHTVTGSGTSMSYNWDGQGDDETNIPNDVYTYVLTAETNGLSGEVVSGGGTNSGGGSPPPFPGSMTESQLYVTGSAETQSPVPLAIYPPGFNTNGLTVFSATPSEIASLHSSSVSTSSVRSSGITFHPDGAGAGNGNSGASNQSSSNNIPKGTQGTIGVCYQQFLNTNITGPAILSGNPLEPFQGLGGQPSSKNNYRITCPANAGNKSIADGFCSAMKKSGYYPAFEYGDDQVQINDLRSTAEGGNSLFNNVNFGMLLTHGNYGTSAESDGVKYTYVFVQSQANNTIANLHLSDFDFGGTNSVSGLRWMTLFICNILYQSNFNSMQNAGKLPINSNLHLLMGGSTEIFAAPDIGKNYADNLLNNETIINAWTDAGKNTYSYQWTTNMVGTTVKFAYAGWSNCTGDGIRSYASPGGSIQYQQTQVFP